MAGNSTSSSSLNSTSNSDSSSNSNSNSNSKAPEKSPTSDSKEEAKSPPSPPPSESKSPPPPSSSDSDSESQSSSPPPTNSSPSPPPLFSRPPSPLPQSNSNDNNNNNNDNNNNNNNSSNNNNDKSSPSPPPPNNSSPSSSTSPSPPPPDNSSSGSSPPASPPPSSPPPSSSSPSPPSSEQSPSPPTSTSNANRDGSGDNGGSQSSTPPTVQQSPPTSPENGGNPSVPAPPGVVPSKTTTTSSSTPLFSPPMSPNNNQPSSSSSPPSLANHGNGRGPPFSSSSSFSSSSKSSSSPPVGIIAGVVAACLLLLLLAVVIICLRKKKKKKTTTPPGMSPYGRKGAISPPGKGTQYWQSPTQSHGVSITPSPGPPMGSSEDYSGQHSGPHHITPNQGVSPGGFGLGLNNKSTFTYEELAAATNGFDQANILGQGGFGYVHKGVLPDGKVIAVKSLKSGSGQGEREFQAEVEIISRVHHRHLVSLVGYCIAHGQRMLVYEFLPNNNLEHHLHKKREPVLDFSTRLHIALGAAKGLAYLHEDCHPRIIHRDIKASNILLDENFEAMVADFGLAKLTSDTNTHVSTRVMGTFGYLAPEYASSGKLTEKSDVFSFGVMLLELITGRRPVDPTMQYMEDSLVDWSRPLLTKALETGNYDELVDPRLEGNYNPQEMQRMVACAAASIRHSARKRPKMSQIVRVLEGDVSLEDLNDGRQSSAYNSSDASSEYDTRAYNADLKKFRQIAFATQDFASSEYGGSTSDYGLNPSSTSSSDSREMKL